MPRLSHYRFPNALQNPGSESGKPIKFCDQKPIKKRDPAQHTMKARVMPDGRLSLPAKLRKKHGLVQGGEVIVEDTGDAIVLRTLDQVVARAQALSRKLVEGKTGSSVDDFLSDRAREAEVE